MGEKTQSVVEVGVISFENEAVEGGTPSPEWKQK
jgi:hypothetical protein